MNDLFDKRTMKDQLLDWMLRRNWTSTADVDQWGLANMHIRARRDAQELCEAGKIRRMTDAEQSKNLGYVRKMGYWVAPDFV